jgi:hypothetical protein
MGNAQGRSQRGPWVLNVYHGEIYLDSYANSVGFTLAWAW